MRRRQITEWFSANVCEVARCRRLDSSHVLVELYLENETEVGLHRFSQSFPDCTARFAATADLQRCRKDHGDAVGCPQSLDEPEAKPLQHLEEQLLELEDLLRNGQMAEATEAFAASPKKVEEESTSDESDEETGQLDLCLSQGHHISLHLRAAVGGGTGARLWTGGMLLAEWLLQATKDGFLLKDKQVLELGAGAAALPSIVAARCGALVTATDGVEEVVEQMRRNVEQNAPIAMRCSLLPWIEAGRRRYTKKEQFDIVLFFGWNLHGTWRLALSRCSHSCVEAYWIVDRCFARPSRWHEVL